MLTTLCKHRLYFCNLTIDIVIFSAKYKNENLSKKQSNEYIILNIKKCCLRNYFFKFPCCFLIRNSPVFFYSLGISAISSLADSVKMVNIQTNSLVILLLPLALIIASKSWSILIPESRYPLNMQLKYDLHRTISAGINDVRYAFVKCCMGCIFEK